MEQLNNFEQSMTAEREAIIAKFGRFIKDIPFMEYNSAQTSAITDKPIYVDRLFETLNNSDTLIMLDEHKFLIDERPGRENPNVQFDRISARSGQNSRHHVFFGTIFTDNYAQDIAVKVFDKEQGGARAMVDEVAKTSAIGQIGLKTFNPVGFGAYGQSYYSFWKLEKQVSTLDSIDWTFFTDNVPGNPGMVSILEKTAKTAAHLHSMGWMHADFHPRNLALDVAGSVFAIDWETANLENVSIDDPEARYQKAYMDISSFLTGCINGPEHIFNAGIGIFQNDSNEEAIAMFDNLFLDNYVKYRESFANDHRELDDIPQLIKDIHEIPEMIR